MYNTRSGLAGWLAVSCSHQELHAARLPFRARVRGGRHPLATSTAIRHRRCRFFPLAALARRYECVGRVGRVRWLMSSLALSRFDDRGTVWRRRLALRAMCDVRWEVPLTGGCHWRYGRYMIYRDFVDRTTGRVVLLFCLTGRGAANLRHILL